METKNIQNYKTLITMFPRPVALKLIICHYMKVNENIVFERDRRRSIADTRMLIATFVYKYTNLSLDKTALFVSRSRTSVVQSIKTVTTQIPLCQFYTELKKIFDEIGIEKYK